MSRHHALVAGGLGVIGRSLATHLADELGWQVTAISRRTPDFETSARYLSVDLQDPEGARAALKQAGPFSHVFFAAYQEHADPETQVAANLEMLRNCVEAAEAASPALERVVLFEGAKYYGAHLGAFPTPAHEDDPRVMPPMFYYDQEDWLAERAAQSPWDHVVMRPDVVCGFAIGNPMNLAMVIAVYAAICKELGLPLRFPGSATCYGKLAQLTDAAQLARGSAWAATEGASGTAYNLTNGDIFRWNHLWKRIAAHLEMDAAEPMPISLTQMMADKGPLWERMKQKYDLVDVPFEKVAAWGFGDFIFNCDWDVISSTTRIRQAGFGDVVDSEEMILRLIDDFRARKVIP
ncbi:SDR family oxidoreductase [Pseudooceanicola sp. CBS1P-1]|uniref:NAD-dependent epimerase/dehydratase family protein n=1 Tax=Pseudooceanicola albus TaxID=2692189 RepID=A0A6L7G6M0_9RHOB|nr:MULTISPECIES: SDR family oxidoreductase [Pseudooceanicola]MBT9386845.1 SDR family oxidoreductase [Pseudooceanicola endophyticus]MXN19332.1 NAD-dependent epimerase/dehydratase family protein [Pseudooceanicola albus]